MDYIICGFIGGTSQCKWKQFLSTQKNYPRVYFMIVKRLMDLITTAFSADRIMDHVVSNNVLLLS